MRFLYIFTLVLVFCIKKYVLCRLLTDLNNNNVIPNHMAKDFSLEEFVEYLNRLSGEQDLSKTRFNFPRSIDAPNYRLGDGRVERFYDPLKLHGFYSRVLFNSLDDDFFGVLQVYAPKIDMSFNYETEGGSGSFKFVVTHEPLQVNMDLGIIRNGNCEIIKREHDAHYFFLKNKMKLFPKFNPESEAGRILLQEIKNTWLPNLYGLIIKSKIHALIADIKNTLLQNPQKFPDLKLYCQRVH